MRNNSNVTGGESGGRRKKSTVTMRAAMFVVWVFFVTMMGVHFTAGLRDSLKTETAYYHEDTESILFKAVYIRDEEQIDSESSDEAREFARFVNSGRGVVSYTNKCGSKLSYMSTAAVAYPTERVVRAERELAELQSQLDILLEAEKFADVSGDGEATRDTVQSGLTLEQLSNVHFRLLRSIAAKDYGQIGLRKSEYLDLQSKIRASKWLPSDGPVFNVFRARIKEIKAQIEKLEKELEGSSSVVSRLPMPRSGYFVGNADGYEGILKFDDAENITLEKIADVIANPTLPVADDVFGKVVKSHKWRLAAVIDTEETKAISTGKIVNLKIGTYPQIVSAEVISVTDAGDGNSVFVFECDVLDEDFVKKRVTSVRLLLDDYVGIYIPHAALTYEYRWRMEVDVDKVTADIIINSVRVGLKLDDLVESAPIKISGIKVHDNGSATVHFDSAFFDERAYREREDDITLHFMAMLDYTRDVGEQKDDRLTVLTFERSRVSFFEEDSMGVYVRNGSILNFSRVVMLRSGEGFIIAEDTTGVAGYLKRYDDIVTSGEDLHGGKHVAWEK